VDVFQKCFDFEDAEEARRAGFYPYFRSISSGQDPVVIMDGHEMIMLGSNNYLGLTSHPEIKEAAIQAVREFGSGTAGSRFLNGTLDIHVELEKELAAFLDAHPACPGVVPLLVGPDGSSQHRWQLRRNRKHSIPLHSFPGEVLGASVWQLLFLIYQKLSK
jgi:hypothetical protein